MEQPVPRGPLAVRWHGLSLPPVRAGAVAEGEVELENAGLVPWGAGTAAAVRLAYHWLDDRGNPILWDGMRTPLGHVVAPGERARLPVRIRGPLPPGRYRLAVDLVDEGLVWFAEVGNAPLEIELDVAPRIERALAARGGDAAALAAQEEPLVPEEAAAAVAHLGERCAPAPDWSRRVLDAHAEGYALVGGAVEPLGGRLRRRRAGDLAPWRPEGGRRRHFPHPLVCPSVVRGVEPVWSTGPRGLPAVEPPADRHFGEPWVHDARIVVRLSL